MSATLLPFCRASLVRALSGLGPNVEIEFPFEIVVQGVPASLQASGETRENWKARVVAAAREQLEGWEFAFEGPLAVTIFYFPEAAMQGDIDNIVKPILDALKGPIYVDDRQVERSVVQKFEPLRVAAFREPSATLTEAISGQKPAVYIRIDTNVDRGGRL